MRYNAEMSDFKYEGVELVEGMGFGMLPENLQELLRQQNGYVAFDGGFHLRGYCDKPLWHSLAAVKSGGDWALNELFSEVQRTDIAFAQDCMGDQFNVMLNQFRSTDGIMLIAAGRNCGACTSCWIQKRL